MGQVLFENVDIFTGLDPDLKPHMSVLIEGDRIIEVREGPIEAPAAERIDGGRRTLMPGLIDAHSHVYISSASLGTILRPGTYLAHYAARFLRDILSYGFTTVRDVAGGDHGLALALKDGLLEGPRYFFGGLL